MKSTGKFGVVAAGHEMTARAAAEILEDGGNAFDATIAGLFAACVPEVVLSSLGGGGCLMAHVADRDTTILYDFFVDTPRRMVAEQDQDFRTVSVNFGTQTQDFQIGLGATATPGMVPGLFAVHQDLARLPMKRLVAPAIVAAKSGVRLNAYQAYLFSIIPDILQADPRAAKWFAPNGQLLRCGEPLHNPDLAETFGWLSEDGPRLFVDGPVGQEIVRQCQEDGGHITLEDLKSYEVKRRNPLWHVVGDHHVALNPAPAASGPLIAFTFALLAQSGGRAARTPVQIARAMDRSNQVRTNLIDQGILDIPDDVLQRHLQEMRRHASAPRGTTHISVIDRAGNAAAATVSNGEGNGRMVGDFGFMLNNMLGEEDLNPNGFHCWQPGTRMSTMMAPTLVRDQKDRWIALGSGGANRIRSAVLQVLIGLLDHGLSAEEAVRAPRLHIEKCGRLSLEGHFPEQIQSDLLATWPEAHVWPEPNMFFGGVHVARDLGSGHFDGAGDARRAGHVIIV